MPSGAKKRKAAKKKKEQQASTNNNNSTPINDSHSQGDDDTKSQDERDSDISEVNSPLSQGHPDDKQSFNEGNKESEITVKSVLPESNPEMGLANMDTEASQKVELDDGFVVEVKELKYEEDVKDRDLSPKDVDSAKELHDDDSSSSSSSSSSSDDETRAPEMQIQEAEPTVRVVNETSSGDVAVIDKDEKPSDRENIIPVPETSSVVDSDVTVVPVSEVASLTLESAEFMNAEAVEAVKSEFTETEFEVAILTTERGDDKIYPLLAAENWVAENTVAENKVITSTTSGPLAGKNVDNSGNNKVCEISDASVDENEGKVSTTSGAEGGHDAQNGKPAGFLGSQPLTAPVGGVARRTSWMSCCGLFDFFSK